MILEKSVVWAIIKCSFASHMWFKLSKTFADFSNMASMPGIIGIDRDTCCKPPCYSMEGFLANPHPFS